MPKPPVPIVKPNRHEDPKREHPDQPPPEDELGGGDFASLQEQPSTDDDKPLD